VTEEEQGLGDFIETLKVTNALSKKDLKANSLTMQLYVYERPPSAVLGYFP
jgi:hypothetical protein